MKPVSAPATAFIDTIGVNVHLAYSWTSYRDEKAVERALDFLDVHRVRDVFIPWASARAKYASVAAAGTKLDLVLPVIDKRVDVAGFVQRVAQLEQRFPGSVSAVEGPNEVDIWPVRSGDLSGLAGAAQAQKDLYAAMRQQPGLTQIPVYSLTLAYSDANKYRALGALTPPADFANAHAYVWSWGTPAAVLPHLIELARLSVPGKPVVVTETGFTTTPSHDYSGVSEATQAVRTVQTLLDAFLMGVQRTYIYELLDTEPDPGRRDAQKNFGLFRYDGTPKPAATAVRNLVSILKQADGRNYGNAASATASILAPGSPSARSLLLRRADGAQCLVLWYESPLRTKRGSEIKPTITKWRVTFDRRRHVSVAGAIEGKVTDAPLGPGNVLELDIGNEPVVVIFGSD